jgi:RNA polymerase sigma factor (sigma-70 family)
MASSEISTWLTDVLARCPQSESDLVDRYAERLLSLARRQLPERLRKRLDPEDLVQSVYRSFFRRLQEGQFAFDDADDVWRLLATITYCKARNLVKHHQRHRRDVRRETPLDDDLELAVPDERHDEPPGEGDVAMLLECLERLLQDVPEHHREIVQRRLEGDSIADIAMRVRRSQRTVHRVLSHVQDLGARQLETMDAG